MKTLIQDNQEILDFTGATTLLGVEDLKPYLSMSRAEREVKKLTGAALYQELLDKYDSNSLTSELQGLLPYAQKPLALLAVLAYLSEGHSEITSAGIKSDRENSAFQWQQRELKESYKEKAYFALDELGIYLVEKKDDFTGFTDSEAYKSLTRHIIQTPQQFSEYVNINDSLRTLLALRPKMQHLEDTRILNLCTADVISDLRKELREEEDEQHFKDLIQLLRPAIAYLTMADAITTLHLHLTADGALVYGLEQNTRNSSTEKPGDIRQLDMYMRDFQTKGDAALLKVQEYLNATASASKFIMYFNSDHYEDPTAEPEPWKDDRNTINLL